MFLIDKRHVENFDVPLFLITVLLLICSIVAIYSASYMPVTNSFKSFYIKQIYWSVIGLGAYFFFSMVNYKKLIQWSYVIYALGLILLIIVLLKGHVGMGAQRWIAFGGLRIQPSEFYKVIWCIITARIFRDFTMEKLGFLMIFKKVILLIPPFVLIFLQPDLGTALIFLAVWGIVLLFRGVSKGTFIIGITALLIIMPVLWSQMKDYQKRRVVTFINPEKDPFGAGYHVIQSKIAVGSGGMFGKGFLNGTQSHLNFLPERHTDFIYSLINEEFGLVGGGIVLLLFIILIYRILTISISIKEPMGKLICIAVVAFIFFQFYVNAAMTLGLMPVVGIPMPFMSYGGSSLLTFMSMLGIVNSIAMRKYDTVADI